MRPHRPAFVVLFAALGLAACATTMNGLRRRATVDLSCDDANLVVTDIGAHGYRVTGCGHGRTYICRERTCEGDGPVVEVEVVDLEAQRIESDDVATALVRATHAEMRRCMHDGAQADVTLTVEIDAEGVIRPIEIEERMGPHEASCVSRVAHGASGPAWAGGGALTLHYGVSPPPLPDPPAVDTTEPGATPEVSPSPAFEPAVVRAAIDRHRAAILACTTGPAIAVSAQWAADGSLTVQLREREGSAEEACVQAALAPEHIDPAPGAAGELLHVVERS